SRRPPPRREPAPPTPAGRGPAGTRAGPPRSAAAAHPRACTSAAANRSSLPGGSRNEEGPVVIRGGEVRTSEPRAPQGPGASCFLLRSPSARCPGRCADLAALASSPFGRLLLCLSAP